MKENELAGVIVDVNGQPLAGANVDLFPAFTGHETTTDDQGMFRYKFDRASKGGTQKFLSLGDIRKFPFPLPPIALQEQFATRISKLEKLKASNIAALEKHNQLFASLQNQAFTGQL